MRAIGAEDMETAYRDMVADEDREREALAWSEGLIGDAMDEPQAAPATPEL